MDDAGSSPVYPTKINKQIKTSVMESDKYDKSFPFEAHVDGHSAFNGGVVGSRPAGGTS